MLIFCCIILSYAVLMDCCVNFGSQTIFATPRDRCRDKDFLPNTNYRAAHSSEYPEYGQAYIRSTGLFEVGLQMNIKTILF